MKAKHILFVTLVWALFLAPSACMSGVFDHTCQCCPEDSCGHEVACLTDPCNLILVPVSQVRSTADALPDAHFSADPPAIHDEDMAGWIASPVTPVIVADIPTLQLPQAALSWVC